MEKMKGSDLVPKSRRSKNHLAILLCLCGSHSIGKSEALTDLGHSLQVKSRYYYEQKGQHDSRDRRISLKKYGKVIGVCTAGDDSSVIDRNLDFLREQHCTIGILAARVETGRDMFAYLKGAASVKHIYGMMKMDSTDLYSRGIVKAGFVDLVNDALKNRNYKDIREKFENIQGVMK